MADTITVALRVAEEAIDEAITKAEAYTDSQVRETTTGLFLMLLRWQTFYSQIIVYYTVSNSVRRQPAYGNCMKLFCCKMQNNIKSALIVVGQ